MKFSEIDKDLNKNSFNPLDLVNFDKIINNTKKGYPSFIMRGDYIKTITKVPGVDFFNYTPEEQEEKANYWGAFLSTLKIPTQVYIHSVPIETDKYLGEVSEKIKQSPYIKKELKEEMLRGLPSTLEYIKQDGDTTPFKKEYYIITSCKIRFDGENLQENKEEMDDKKFTLGSYRDVSEVKWKIFEEGFNRYYNEMMAMLLNIFSEESLIEPLNREEKIIGLFAEINNDIDREKIKDIKHIL